MYLSLSVLETSQPSCNRIVLAHFNCADLTRVDASVQGNVWEQISLRNLQSNQPLPRITESRAGQAGRDHRGSPGATSLLQQGHPRAQGLGLCPEGYGISPGRRLHTLWFVQGLVAAQGCASSWAEQRGGSLPDLLPVLFPMPPRTPIPPVWLFGFAV